MNTIKLPFHTNITILALGAESAGNFAVVSKSNLYHSQDFGDLLIQENFELFKKELSVFLKEKNLKPEAIITDLHPHYVTTALGKNLSKKYGAKCIQVQHHHSHTFASIGDYLLSNPKSLSQISTFYSIAMDGTGFGLDEKIWGGEVFELKFKNQKSKIIKNTQSQSELNKIERIGHLENQTLLGGELAIKEPARMIISILSKLLPKEEIFPFIKKHYNKNQFELLHSQLRQNFNCQETSSSGRILDAVSVLLGFSENIRGFKHGPIVALEKNSTDPYSGLRPKIETSEGTQILNTTYLFEYLVKNIHQNKKRLAATAQIYIANGLHKIILKSQISPLTSQVSNLNSQLFISGGVSNNKIIANFIESQGAWKNKKIPRGDAGLSVGQIFYYFSN